MRVKVQYLPEYDSLMVNQGLCLICNIDREQEGVLKIEVHDFHRQKKIETTEAFFSDKNKKWSVDKADIFDDLIFIPGYSVRTNLMDISWSWFFKFFKYQATELDGLISEYKVKHLDNLENKIKNMKELSSAKNVILFKSEQQ